MLAFLDTMDRTRHDEQAWEDALQCLDLSQVKTVRSRELATKLLGILNRLGRVDRRSFPDPGEKTSFTYFPQPNVHHWVVARTNPQGNITLVKTESGHWVFSAQTMAGVDQLYDSLKHLPIRHGVDERRLNVALWIESYMPASLRTQELLTLKYWQWAGLFILILLGILLDQVVRLVLRLLTHRVIARQQATAQADTIAKTVRPLGLLAASLVWLGLVRVLGLPDAALMVLLAAVRVFAILAGTLAAWCVTDLVSEILTEKAALTATKFDDVLVPLLRKTVKIFVVAFGLIYAAAALSIPIMPMLTSLGIGGLAFAFAAKDTIENFFGSVAVILDRPFEVGDWVVIGDVEGTVEEVGFRSTRIRTFYNSQITVANATLVRATVDNYGRRRYRRVKTHISIQYDTPPDIIIAFTEGIRELVRSHPYTRKDYFQVWLHQFGPSSLDVLLYVFHEAPDWTTELRERERLFLDIIRLADQLGVQFAFPTQTVHLYQEQADAAHEPSQTPNRATDHRAAAKGVRTVQQLIQNQPWRNAKPGPVTFQEGPTPPQPDDEDSDIENRTAGS